MRKNYFGLYILFFVLLSFTACKKDKGFGSNLLPEDNPLNLDYIEDEAITAHSLFESPLRTDRMLFNYLGYLEDPILGNTTGRVSIQYGLPSEVDTSLTPFTVESVSLNMYYDNFFGDTSIPVNLNVYRLQSKFNTNITYNSDFVPPYDHSPIGQLENYHYGSGFLKDSTGIISGHIEIPLENSYGEEIVNLLKTGLIRNDTLFYTRFPGLFIQPQDIQLGKAMVQLDLTNILGGVYLKLKDKNGEDLTFILPFSNSRFVHNNLEHQYQGSVVENAILNGGTGSQNQLYIQSQAGVKTEVAFENLSQYKGKLINKAVVEIYEVEKNPKSLRVLSVYPLMKGKSGENVAIKDYTSTYYGPTYVDSSQTDSHGEILYRYQVNITNLLKEYALGKVDFKSIYLTNYPVFSTESIFVLDQATTIQSQHIEPADLIFGSENYADSERRMRFKVWYSQPK
ncbi:MAG: DUF4270 domain-containing protein [Chitinophagales bacterium]|nr:DUF4270 domain-containing protein [Chitinophagales bacterium]